MAETLAAATAATLEVADDAGFAWLHTNGDLIGVFGTSQAAQQHLALYRALVAGLAVAVPTLSALLVAHPGPPARACQRCGGQSVPCPERQLLVAHLTDADAVP